MKIIRLVTGPLEVNCYIVYDEHSGKGVVIDPGGDEERIMQILSDHQVNTVYIINTHGHPDHTSGNAYLREATGAPLVMHAEDDDFYQRPERLRRAREEGFTPSPPADLRVEDGHELRFGGLTAHVLHTPGHTPGACCLLIADHLFTGDTLLAGTVGRTDRAGGSLDQLLASIEHKILTLPPNVEVHPGHSYGGNIETTIGTEMKENPYITDFILNE